MLRSSGAIRSSVQPSLWRSISASISSRSTSTPSTSSRVNSGASRSTRSSSGRPVTSCWYSATTAARRWSLLRTRHVLAGAGVHAHAVADVDEQRYAHRDARLERRRLVAAAGRGVAAEPRLGLGHGHLDGARHLHLGRTAVDVEDVDLLALEHPPELVGHLLLRDAELLVGLGVHEVRLAAVGVEVLEPPGLGAHRAELLAGAEGLVDRGAVGRPLQLRPDERAALARLDVLELDDLEDGPVHLDVGPVLELVGADHGGGG